MKPYESPGRVWRLAAACAGLPTDWWFPHTTQPNADTRFALETCQECPVRRQCAADALASHEMHGIRAGVWIGAKSVRVARKQLTRIMQGRR